jgi:hypothetical protein
MDKCDSCANWTTRRVTRYGDGSEVVNWRAPGNRGRCSVLDVDTQPTFGCVEHAPGDEHVVGVWKNGAPWQHWIVGSCPDCGGAGSGGAVCSRCAGTGKVRHYDDGHVGEEQTRLHPRERENAEPLKCVKCSREIDVRWMACPMCGTRLEPVAKTEVVEDALPPAREKAA